MKLREGAHTGHRNWGLADELQLVEWELLRTTHWVEGWDGGAVADFCITAYSIGLVLDLLYNSVLLSGTHWVGLESFWIVTTWRKIVVWGSLSWARWTRLSCNICHLFTDSFRLFSWFGILLDLDKQRSCFWDQLIVVEKKRQEKVKFNYVNQWH